MVPFCLIDSYSLTVILQTCPPHIMDGSLGLALGPAICEMGLRRQGRSRNSSSSESYDVVDDFAELSVSSSVASSLSASVDLTEPSSAHDQANDLAFLAAHSISVAAVATVQAGPWPQTLRFYHGTSYENALSIEQNGFTPSPREPSCLGEGVYVGRPDKAVRFAQDRSRHGSDVGGLIEVRVKITNPKFVSSDDKSWQAAGFDACRTDQTSRSNHMEWCIARPSQITVERVMRVPEHGTLGEAFHPGLVERVLSQPRPSPTHAPTHTPTNAAPPTRANMQALEQAQRDEGGHVRRQFVCPEHGAFWKKVPAAGNKRGGLCVARCKRCPVVNGAGLKYVAIPVEQERGKGLYTCDECENTWTSNTACRSLQQYCFAEGCTARDRMHGVYPREVRAPDPGWLRAKRFAKARRDMPPIDEDAPVHSGAPESTEGGGGAFEPPEPRLRSPPNGRRHAHWCAGCATGACKEPPPPSRPHESTGSTASSVSGRTWSTANSDWSAGSAHSDRSPATQSRSRRRMFLAGGAAGGAAEPLV